MLSLKPSAPTSSTLASHPEDTERALEALTELAADLYEEGTVKACACGAVYDAPGWADLPLAGTQTSGAELFELRHCYCGSTIAIVLGPAPPRR